MPIQTRLVHRLLLLLLVAVGCGVQGGLPENNLLGSTEITATSPRQLSSEGQAAMLSLIDTGSLPDLRWPSFLDYRPAVKRFYESVGHRLVWIRGTEPTDQARLVIRLLQSAERKGLDPQDYDGPRWADHLARLQEKGSEINLVRFDLALTVSAMRYASDLHTGRVNPHLVNFDFAVAQDKGGLSEFLRRKVVDAADVETAFEQLEPPFTAYQCTQRALETYRRLAREDDGELLPAVKRPVQPGRPYPGIARLTRFLRRVGDLAADSIISPHSLVYKGALVDAVKHFQERHGLAPDGRLDRDTVRQLNTPLARRVDQLQLALERWRWIPFASPQPSIVVNLPEFLLRAYDDEHQPVLTMRVLVGKAQQNSTPVFLRQMKYVVFRPYWDVPPRIESTELLPEIAQDQSYIAKHDYEIVDPHTRVVSNVETADLLKQLLSGQLSIRQKPGGKNSLGLVKFVFPNEYDVYIHDTPTMKLFAKSRRDLTHGCIRVESAEELAVWALRFNPGWTRDTVRAAMNGNKTVYVKLTKPFPVLIMYVTAMVLETGEVHFCDDVYDYDAVLHRVLAERHSH